MQVLPGRAGPQRARVGALFNVINRGSAALTAHDTIVHPLVEAGRFELRIFREPDHAFVRRIVLAVQASIRPLSVAVDLSLPAEARAAAATEHPVCAGGALGLHGGGSERAGASAQLWAQGSDPIWDSRALVAGDQFVFVLVRPGLHVLVEKHSGWTQGLRVRYPDPRTPRTAGDAPQAKLLRLEAGAPAVALEPLWPAQTVSVALPAAGLGGAAFEVRLETADDGPADLAAWRRRIDEEAMARLGQRPASGADVPPG